MSYYKDNVKITFKHWKTGDPIVMTGILPEQYNYERSELYVLLKQDGTFEDIRKNTVIDIEYGI